MRVSTLVSRSAERARRQRRWFAAGRVVGLVATAIVVGMAVGADQLAPYDPFELAGSPLEPPSSDHLMGTDNLGRDLFSSVVHGARTSLMVAVATTMIATMIGLVIGLQAGYRGGYVDNVLMRLTEFVQIIPRFFMAIVVLAMFGEGYRNLVLVLALTSWPVMARSVRSIVLSVRQRPYVSAAVAIGATRRRSSQCSSSSLA